MKKIIVILLVFCCVSVLASCDKESDDGKTLETAESYVELTGQSGSLTMDESVARTLLEVYDRETLGLSKDFYDYELKLSNTRFSNDDACLVEAFLEKEEKPEGTFIIYGQQCFVYNEKRKEYLLLTVDGPVKYDFTEKQEEASTTVPSFLYDEENNKKLHEMFSSYSKNKLGIKKDLEEYVLVAIGTTTTAENGETVYVVRLYEKNGEATNITLAFNDDGCYAFDAKNNTYEKL